MQHPAGTLSGVTNQTTEYLQHIPIERVWMSSLNIITDELIANGRAASHKSTAMLPLPSFSPSVTNTRL